MEDAKLSLNAGFRWDHSYLALPEPFYARLRPQPVRAPRLVLFNRDLALQLGLDPDALEKPEQAAIFAGNVLPEGAKPLAQAYSGHQFGHFTTLGDGRALLLGEHITPQGERFDIQLKGSGPTPFSRGGDGRAALGPMLREYLISEGMAALGIPTTRSLAVATTGEMVLRQAPLPGALLTRVAASHIRVGTFQHFAARQDDEAVRRLVEYTRKRHYPEAEGENPALALLQSVAERQAALIAGWLSVGFIHGVMNTDNMALSGETIDYGPCAFLDTYDPTAVFSSIDHQGRYAFENQPKIAQWNLARFAEAILRCIDSDPKRAIPRAEAVIGEFPSTFERKWLARMRPKLGLRTEEPDDRTLIEGFLSALGSSQTDYTNGFRSLTNDDLPDQEMCRHPSFGPWHEAWRARLARQGELPEQARERMRGHNPFVIPRNHRVEEALRAAEEQGNFEPAKRLLEVLARPYAELPEHEAYQRPPTPAERVRVTYCGT